MSPFDSITTNRPFADVSPTKELTGFVAELRTELVIWLTNASGVEFAGLWAEVSAPATSMHAPAAQRKAIISLNIKKPKELKNAHWGVEPK